MQTLRKNRKYIRIFCSRKHCENWEFSRMEYFAENHGHVMNFFAIVGA